MEDSTPPDAKDDLDPSSPNTTLSKEQRVWMKRAEERMNSTYEPKALSHEQWKETPGGLDYQEKKTSSGEGPSRPNWMKSDRFAAHAAMTGPLLQDAFQREWNEAEAHDLFWNYPYSDTFEEPVAANDTVEQPSHYTYANIECIDAIREVLGESFWAYCIGNALKYIWRHRHKGGVEDLRKAQVYLGWAVEGL